MKGFELVVADSGLKMRKSEFAEQDWAKAVVVQSGPPKRDANGFPVLDHPGLMTTVQMRSKGGVARQTAKYQSTSDLLNILSNQLHAPIEDKTGLKDHYDYTLQHAMDMAGINIVPPTEGPLDRPTYVGQKIV